MKVITLSPELFEAEVRRLADMVADEPTARFDAVVGVRRGGSVVCDVFCRHFPRSRYGMRTDVALGRPSTARKEGRLGRLLMRLPRPLLDVMRMAESRLLEWSYRRKSRAPLPAVALPDDLTAVLRATPAPTVLLIDDALDSGTTLAAIKEAMSAVNPAVRVVTAVLTQTTPRPRIAADYTLYNNRTLIRFPWSNDYPQARPR